MPNAYDLSGTTAVVTGGLGGIGRAVAHRLDRSGSEVWVVDVGATDDPGDRSLAVDLTSQADVARAFDLIAARSASIDILVNAAGYLGPFGRFDDMPDHERTRVIDVNLGGVLSACSAALPHMRRADRGRIVNMGSLAGKHGLADLAVYSAASAGVITFTKALGRELADTGIRVNCVAPGPIDTTMITRLASSVVDAMIASSPMRRLGTPEEVAELVVWLCSDAASFTTGAVFDISGGRAAY